LSRSLALTTLAAALALSACVSTAQEQPRTVRPGKLAYQVTSKPQGPYTVALWFDTTGRRRNDAAKEQDLAACRFAIQSIAASRPPGVFFPGSGANTAAANIINADEPDLPSFDDCMLARGWRFVGYARPDDTGTP
jgi:hypothetical protein